MKLAAWLLLVFVAAASGKSLPRSNEGLQSAWPAAASTTARDVAGAPAADASSHGGAVYLRSERLKDRPRSLQIDAAGAVSSPPGPAQVSAAPPHGEQELLQEQQRSMETVGLHSEPAAVVRSERGSSALNTGDREAPRLAPKTAVKAHRYNAKGQECDPDGNWSSFLEQEPSSEGPTPTRLPPCEAHSGRRRSRRRGTGSTPRDEGTAVDEAEADSIRPVLIGSMALLVEDTARFVKHVRVNLACAAAIAKVAKMEDFNVKASVMCAKNCHGDPPSNSSAETGGALLEESAIFVEDGGPDGGGGSFGGGAKAVDSMDQLKLQVQESLKKAAQSNQQRSAAASRAVERTAMQADSNAIYTIQTVTVAGFPVEHGHDYSVFNGIYVERRSAQYRVNGRETYWADFGQDETYFLYYCSRYQVWAIGAAPAWANIRAGACVSSAATGKGAEILDPIMVKFRSVWDGMTWRGLSKPAGVVALGRQATPNMVPPCNGSVSTTVDIGFAGGEDHWWQAKVSTAAPGETTEDDASVNAVARAAVDAANTALKGQDVPFSEDSIEAPGHEAPRKGIVHVAFKIKAPADRTTMQELMMLETEDANRNVLGELSEWADGAKLGRIQGVRPIEVFVASGPLAEGWKNGKETWIDFDPEVKPPPPEDLEDPVVIFVDIENIEYNAFNESRLACITHCLAMQTGVNFGIRPSQIVVDYPSKDLKGKLQADVMFNSDNREGMVQLIDSKDGRDAWKHTAVSVMGCPGVSQIQTGAVAIDHVHVTFQMPPALRAGGFFKRFVAYLKANPAAKWLFLASILFGISYYCSMGAAAAPPPDAAGAAGAADASGAAAPAAEAPKEAADGGAGGEEGGGASAS
eukprot:TRINITY_DN49245_c0_g1_i1.p1 TRINITY_DN49245_c0_g1~~TRINITY_DN49245_c0_g1_i1.p1  ORF type:complete len:863 (+),score=213.50 TRINITY_DN49245_c0_g1_i1:171-2759(+)